MCIIQISFILFLFRHALGFSTEAKTTESIVRTQCRSACLSEFGTLYRRKLRNGSSYKQFRCDGDCQPCWYSCDSLSQTEDLCFMGCDVYNPDNRHKCIFACKALFQIQKNIMENNALPKATVSNVSKIEGIELMCMSLQGEISSPTVLGIITR